MRPKSEVEMGSSSYGESQAGTSTGSSPRLSGIRRVPRVVWLGMSALTLIAGSLAWHFQHSHLDAENHPATANFGFFSKKWWTQPRVRNAGAALPEIAGQIYGIAVETSDQARLTRIWIVGSGGLLAYSEDDGKCWTSYEYHSDRGEFRESQTSFCGDRDQSRLYWPQLVPTVLAAERSQSKPAQRLPDQQPTNAPAFQQQPAQQQVPQDNQAYKPPASAPTAVTVFPTSIDFGDVSIPNTPAAVVPGKAFVVRNLTSKPVSLFASGLTGDANGEFSLQFSSCKPDAIAPGQECSGVVSMIPRVAGKKFITIQLQNDLWQSPVIVTIHAIVHAGDATNSGSKSPAPDTSNKLSPSSPLDSAAVGAVAPPSSAPDLLAIQTSSNPRIVSTGGTLWARKDRGVWVLQPVRAGTTNLIGEVNWSFESPTKGPWATETRVKSLGALSLPAARYPCADCRIRSQVSSERTSETWAVGWATDASGDHGVILRSRDKEKTWEAISRGALSAQERAAAASGRAWMWPPSWFWAVLALTALLALPALLPPPDVRAEVQGGSVEGRLSSDKPLDPGDLDVLGLTGIALGLSRFLRNKKTLPPLTIAVNGEWGSGKSSLMNLLRCDLRSYGMRAVWFNAWHHQKEEYLLAALLQTVRLEAVPPIWNLLGIPFRVRLLAYRFRRRWQPLLLLATALIFLVALDSHLRTAHQSDLFLWISNQLMSANKTSESPLPLPVQGGLVAVIATAVTLWKGLTAFGANPASLLASAAKGNKLKDLDAQTSFRQRFAVEFRDVTNALGPRRPLVVFIDDLDRCLPENVRDVLEAVNFLVSSGDCFVVLGIDRVQVQRAIGLSFKDVAEEAGYKNGTVPVGNPIDAAAEVAREKRAEFAQKYLDKLINLEVRVPQAVDDATKQRLFEPPAERRPESAADVAFRMALEASKWAVPAALAMLVLVGAVSLSKKVAPAVEDWMRPVSALNTGPTQANLAAGAAAGSPSSATTGQPADSKGQSETSTSSNTSTNAALGELVAPASGKPPIIQNHGVWPAEWILSIPLYLAAVFILLVANVVLTVRPGVVTHDSQQFTEAMEKVWYPLVLARQNTPRAAKRFINRVRYLAMRQRGYEEHASAWERVLFPDRLREPARSKDWKPIPEPLLVALAAIEQMQPQWIYNDAAFRQVAGGDGTAELTNTFPASIPDGATLLTCARSKHQETFSSTSYLQRHADWGSLPIYRETFVTIWPQITPESA